MPRFVSVTLVTPTLFLESWNFFLGAVSIIEPDWIWVVEEKSLIVSKSIRVRKKIQIEEIISRLSHEIRNSVSFLQFHRSLRKNEDAKCVACPTDANHFRPFLIFAIHQKLPRNKREVDVASSRFYSGCIFESNSRCGRGARPLAIRHPRWLVNHVVRAERARRINSTMSAMVFAEKDSWMGAKKKKNFVITSIVNLDLVWIDC